MDKNDVVDYLNEEQKEKYLELKLKLDEHYMEHILLVNEKVKIESYINDFLRLKNKYHLNLIIKSNDELKKEIECLKEKIKEIEFN